MAMGPLEAELVPIPAEVGGDEAGGLTRRRAWSAFSRRPLGMAGLAVVGIYCVVAIFAPLITPHNPNESFTSSILRPPSEHFLFGTDEEGRDILSRVMIGVRPALILGIASVGIGALLGTLTGFIAGYWRGGFAGIVMRMWDGAFAIPVVLLGVLLAATFGESDLTIAIAVGIASAPALARVAFAVVVDQMGRGYVEALRSLGVRPRRIFLSHVVPNSLGSVVVQLALTMTGAILAGATLSFLGVGPPPPAASWGQMLSDSQQYLANGAWWYGVFPGAALTVLVVAVNLVADAARDALDPMSRR